MASVVTTVLILVGTIQISIGSALVSVPLAGIYIRAVPRQVVEAGADAKP